MAEMPTKRCTRCGQTLPEDRFYRQGVRRQWNCKACVKALRGARQPSAGTKMRPPASQRRPDYSPEVWDRELRAVNRAFNHTMKTIFGPLHRAALTHPGEHA